MFHQHRQRQFEMYNRARLALLQRPDYVIATESLLATTVAETTQGDISEIARDFNEASYLYPFWQQYPPDNRGREPRGDQFPWIEVGEHVITAKLTRLLATRFELRDPGLPTGADARFLLRSLDIRDATQGLTDAAWLMIDIKSVGPRDDAAHTVLSHNQVSGDGLWRNMNHGVENRVIRAAGRVASHDFHPSIAPIYVLSDGTVALTVIVAVKPVYAMLALQTQGQVQGQPLERIDVITIPNGLLLMENPRYTRQYPGLFFPGKDDKGKNPSKMRARISFQLLRQIADWRVKSIAVDAR